MNNYEISVIIPVFNEAASIGRVLNKIKTLYPDFEIIVVNDGSLDNSAEVARQAGAIVYSHPYNIGNGAAVKSGIRIASGDIIVLMDGDGQHDPKDIQELLKFLPEYDMAVGSRSKRNQASLLRAFGNRLFNNLASYVTKFQIQDLTSGFRAVKTDIARDLLYLLPNTYSYPTTITLGVLRGGRSLKYVPMNIQGRKEGKSKIRAFRDGVRFFIIITKICALYSPFRIFLPISFLLFISGLLNYLFTYLTMGRFTNMSALLFSTSIIIFMMGLVSEQICQMRFERSEGGGRHL
jgi:glycosyltransferase involved in cell wall biosynthesis